MNVKLYTSGVGEKGGHSEERSGENRDRSEERKGEKETDVKRECERTRQLDGREGRWMKGIRP